MEKFDLSIIIVSWNVAKLLHACLDSIFRQQGGLELEVIVVDNRSDDDTVAMIKQTFPQVTLIANGTNHGFARANNQGILASHGRYILLLNPDTVVINGSLEKMVSAISNIPRVGILGCKHLNPNRTLQPSVRRFPTALAILLIATKLAKLLPNLPWLRYYFAKDFDYKKSQNTEQVAGSCMLIRRDVFDEIGLFDEKFFIWFEEVDLCKRAWSAGWQVWYIPQATIIHYGGQSFSHVPTLKKQRQFFQSALYYFRKHGFDNEAH